MCGCKPQPRARSNQQVFLSKRQCLGSPSSIPQVLGAPNQHSIAEVSWHPESAQTMLMACSPFYVSAALWFKDLPRTWRKKHFTISNFRMYLISPGFPFILFINWRSWLWLHQHNLMLILAMCTTTHLQFLSVSPEPVANRPRWGMGFPPPFPPSPNFETVRQEGTHLTVTATLANVLQQALLAAVISAGNAAPAPQLPFQRVHLLTNSQEEEKGGGKKKKKKQQTCFAIAKIQTQRLGLKVFPFLFCSGLLDLVIWRSERSTFPCRSTFTPALLAAESCRGTRGEHTPLPFPRGRHRDRKSVV